LLLIEHNMEFVMENADYVYVMSAGKVISSGTPQQVRNDADVLEAYLGSQVAV
jgi:branched-chain amino acid transport system ATP-binding protein